MKTQTTAQPETIFDRELRPLVEREVMSNPAQATSAAVRDVLAERQRQIEAEGWTPEHDDRHIDDSLAIAAACYARPFDKQGTEVRIEPVDVSGGRGDCPVWSQKSYTVPKVWPTSWAPSWWKPKSRRRDLVRAAAMIIAEIERMDRAKS